MFSVEVKGEVDEWLTERMSHYGKKMENKVKDATFRIEGKVKDNLKPHFSTGNLQRSYSSDFHGSGFSILGRVGTNKNYSIYLEKGTRPHWVGIEKLERWAQQKGINVYAIQKSIAQKGTKAHPHLAPAGRDVLSIFDWSL